MTKFNSTPPPPRDSTPCNANIDCLKALCACFVVCLHFTIRLGPFNIICGVAVPCFFMISGFLLYNSDNVKFRQRITKNIKNVLWITFWASLLYFTFKIIQFIFHPDEYLFSVNDLGNLILFNNTQSFGPHLWYLFAYIYVLIIYYFLSRFNLVKYTKYAIPFLVLGFILLGKWSYFLGLKTDYRWTQNFLFDGMTFFTIGMFIKENLEMIRLKIRRPVIFFVIFLLIAMVERQYFRSCAPYYYAPGSFSTTFLATSLFLMFILCDPRKENWFSWIGKELSLYIYIFHNIIGWELQNIAVLKPVFGSVGALLVLLATILFSYLFIKAKDFIFSRLKARQPLE